MTPTISIIIVTHNSAVQIGACLRALQQQRCDAEYEIVVVDNASRDESRAIVAGFPAARLVAEAENWGFAGGVNRGVATAHGRMIALLNPDAEPAPDWLQQLIAALDDPRIGVVGSKVLGHDRRIQSLGSSLQLPVLLSAYRGAGQPDTTEPGAIVDVWAVHGAAMAFARPVWEVLGGFDEGFFPAYWEESDFCERARQAGYRVVVAPQAVVLHHEASATGKYSPEFYFYYHRNRLRYAAKWLDWPMLWGTFRPAEHARLRTAPLLDRRVAREAYHAGVPPLGRPDAQARAATLATGQALRSGMLPDDGFEPLMQLIGEADANAVLEEVRFQSHLPLVARLRAAWNDVATRWYVRPSLDQQTRFNLATERALAALAEQTTARSAADALDIALLAWAVRRLESLKV
ncbi:MAG TPA: glycosyltransferase family 2 protein [Roseiflexaceae bacterium]|nr:glycosyltransferase family 2 protein [Roseiflexaceae bacterium]